MRGAPTRPRIAALIPATTTYDPLPATRCAPPFSRPIAALISVRPRTSNVLRLLPYLIFCKKNKERAAAELFYGKTLISPVYSIPLPEPHFIAPLCGFTFKNPIRYLAQSCIIHKEGFPIITKNILPVKTSAHSTSIYKILHL